MQKLPATMKVLHVITTLGRGGIEQWLVSMLEEVSRAECAMDICCKGSSVGVHEPRVRELGAQVYLRPLSVTQVGFVKALRELVMAGKYDIVHSHLHAYSGLAALACKPLGVPVITSFHVTDLSSEGVLLRPLFRQARNLYAKISVKYALRHSAMITGCSQGVVDSIRQSYSNAGAHHEQWRVLPYGTDLPPLASKEDRRAFRASFGWPEDTPLVVHVGRFAEQKNHLGLLKIFEQVVQQVPNAKLLLIGGGGLQPSIEAAVGAQLLSESVKFLGLRDDVTSVLTRSDLFLFPSWFEGLGVAVLEASASGLPVVASKIAGVIEAVKDGVTGILCDPYDTASMVAACIAYLTDHGFARRCGMAGRKRISEQFSKAASAAALLRAYHECPC